MFLSKLPHIMLLLVVVLLVVGSEVSYANTILQPNVEVLSFLEDMDVSFVVTYSGTDSDPPEGAVSCTVDVIPQGAFGLNAEVYGDIACNPYTGSVSIQLLLKGVFTGTGEPGGGVKYVPISSASITYYDENGVTLKSESISVVSLTIYSAELLVENEPTKIEIDGNIGVGKIPSIPQFDEAIYFYTTGDILVPIYVNPPLSQSTEITITYSQAFLPSRTVTLTINANTPSVVASLRNVDLTQTLTVTVYGVGDKILAEANIDLPRVVQLYNITTTDENIELTSVRLVVGTPIVISTVDTTSVEVPVYIYKISPNTNVTIKVELGNNAVVSKTYSQPVFDYISVNTDLLSIIGTSYNVIISVKGAETRLSTGIYNKITLYGGIVEKAFLMAFLFLSVASFVAIVAGLILRRPDIMTNGVLGLASTVIVFMIPTIITYLLIVLFRAGIPNPVNIENVTVMNIGSVIDRSLLYTSMLAIKYGNTLIFIAKTLTIAILGLSAISAGSKIISLILGSALSAVISGYLSILITISILSFFAGYLLIIIGNLYPVVMSIVLVILLFMILLYALFSAFSGNFSQVYIPIIQFSVLTFAIMLIPSMLSAVDEVRVVSDELIIDLPDFIQELIGRIPDPFFWLVSAITQIFILVLVLYMSLTRMLSLVSTGQ